MKNLQTLGVYRGFGDVGIFGVCNYAGSGIWPVVDASAEGEEDRQGSERTIADPFSSEDLSTRD